jgi:hypothetical protein
MPAVAIVRGAIATGAPAARIVETGALIAERIATIVGSAVAISLPTESIREAASGTGRPVASIAFRAV